MDRLLPLRRRLAASLAALCLCPAAAPAAEPAAAQPQPQVREGMAVKIANRQIIVLRGPIAGLTARERAMGSMQRIEQALDAQPEAAVSTEEVPEGTKVLVGGKHAFLVTQIDIDPQAGETTQIVAKLAAERLAQAIAERREQKTPRYLAIAAAVAAAASLLYAGLLWLVLGANRWIGGRLSLAAARGAHALRVGGHRLLDASRVLTLTQRAITLGAWAVAAVLTSIWLGFVLTRFPYTRPWGEQLEGQLLEMARDVLLAIAGALPGLLLAAVIFLVARTIVRVLAVFFDRVERGNTVVGWIDADTARPTQRIASFVVWVFALAIAYPYLPGAQTEAFKGLSVLLGLMASLGAASFVGQAFSGFILMYSRAYRAGDFVRIGETEGTVQALGTFVTRLRTGAGEELTIPNSLVMGATVRNFSRAGPDVGSLIETGVTIGYGTPWRQVHDMLEEAVRRTPDLSAEPKPFVRQAALSDFYPEYRLIVHTPMPDGYRRLEVLSRLHANIQDVFSERGVQIMSPHYMGDPSEPQIPPRGTGGA